MSFDKELKAFDVTLAKLIKKYEADPDKGIHVMLKFNIPKEHQETFFQKAKSKADNQSIPKDCTLNLYNLSKYISEKFSIVIHITKVKVI